MRPANYIPSPALLLSAFGVTLLSTPAMAQNDKKPDDNSKDGDSAKPDDKAKPSADDDKPKSSAESSSSSSSASSSSSSSADSKPTETAASGIPSITGPNGLPTLTGNPAIPTYPPPTIPPTKDAPFMQKSSAPEGTVFIAVGAILGAFGVAILLWRAIVSLLLHRSVERAAAAQQTKTKSGFPAPPAPFYKYTDQDSTMSLGGGAGTGAGPRGRGTRRTNRGTTPSTNLSNSQLFFSPTAAATGNGAGNRSSQFLPSGFYAAGTSSPGPQQQGNSIGLANLAPDARGNYVDVSRHSFGGSPPDTPPFNPRRDMSTSSVNLGAPLQPGQRAPSAYLDDLLADEPTGLPPAGMHTPQRPRGSQ